VMAKRRTKKRTARRKTVKTVGGLASERDRKLYQLRESVGDNGFFKRPSKAKR